MLLSSRFNNHRNCRNQRSRRGEASSPRYNVLEGRVWPLFLLWLTISPYVFYSIKD
jgi:hypothetical protein